jgi:hypothetical protein
MRDFALRVCLAIRGRAWQSFIRSARARRDASFARLRVPRSDFLRWMLDVRCSMWALGRGGALPSVQDTDRGGAYRAGTCPWAPVRVRFRRCKV